MLFVRKGWIEPGVGARNQTQVVLEYRLLTAEEYRDLSFNSDYAHTPVTTGSLAGTLAAILQVPPHSMLAKGLSFASQEPLTEDGTCEFSLGAGHWNVRIRLLGRLTHVRIVSGLKEKLHYATLHLTAANQGDLKRLTQAMTRRK
jgi:hypothetical protein